MVGRQFRWYFG